MTAAKQKAASDQALHKALAHPARHGILRICDERPASPTELAEDLSDGPYDRRFFKQVTYHVDWLAKNGLLELVETDNRKGGTQHFYKTIRRPMVDMEQAAGHSRVLREAQAEPILAKMMEDVQRAVRGGTMADHPQWSLLREKGVVDEQGMNETAEACEAHLEEIKDIFARSAGRLADSGESGRNVATHTLVFPLPGKGGQAG